MFIHPSHPRFLFVPPMVVVGLPATNGNTTHLTSLLSPSRSFTSWGGAGALVCSTAPRLYASRGGHFRPFSADDEAQLVAVLSTKPRHVARYIRQSMQNSRKRIMQFRNSVTYLMILLQSKMQRKELNPEDATAIVESVMRECVELRQSDMAHLLFRASLRFRKYGLTVTHTFVKLLFDSYRSDNAKDLMKSLAEELKDDEALRSLSVTAYIFAGMPLEAEAVWKTLDPSALQTADLCSIVDGFCVIGEYDKVVNLVKEILEKEANTYAHVDTTEIVSTAIVSSQGNTERQLDLVKLALSEQLILSDRATGAVARGYLAAATSIAEVHAIEEELKVKLRRRTLGMYADTAFIGKCSELIAFGQAKGDAIMATKLFQLRGIIENAVETDTISDLDPSYVLSLIKGYGVLGKMEEVRGIFDKLRNANALKDHHVYDEMLKWYAFSYNVKEVIALKEDMTARHIYHTAYTYHNVFRVLDKYYPRMVEKYLAEMRSKGMSIEGFMYPTLLRVFSGLEDRAAVEQLYNEIRGKAMSGNVHVYSPPVIIQLLKSFSSNQARCEEIIYDANKLGLLSNEALQAELVQYYSVNGREDDIRQLMDRLPYKSPHMYRVLLRNAAIKRDRATFSELLNEIQKNGVPMNDRIFSVILTALSHFNDLDGVKHYVSQAVARNTVSSPMFFADAAAAFARLGDAASVDACWKDLLETNMTITMPVYNRFLDLYMASNNLDMVQQILNTMMKLVPPNPVTATTVVDMLGKMGRLTEMDAVLKEMRHSANAAPTLVTYHQAMNAYAKHGDIANMEQIRASLREEGFQENHVTYNILADGYGRAKRYEHLQELLEERLRKGIAMEEFGFVILLNTYARARMGPETMDLVEQIERSDVEISSRMLVTIATAFSFVGDIPKMEEYIHRLLSQPGVRQRDVESVYMIYSRMRDVVKLQEMLDMPNLLKTELVYNICVAAFARAGEHTKVALLLQEMEKREFTLSRNTSVILSSLLLKAGKLQLAQAVLRWKGVGGIGDVDVESTTTEGKEGEEGEGEAAAAATLTRTNTTTTTPLKNGVKKLVEEAVDDEEDNILQRHLDETQPDVLDTISHRAA